MPDASPTHAMANYVIILWVVVAAMYTIVGLRFWALRQLKYPILSSHGLSSMFILAAVFLTTTICGMVSWKLLGPLHRTNLDPNPNPLQREHDVVFPPAISARMAYTNTGHESHLQETLMYKTAYWVSSPLPHSQVCRFLILV